MFVYVCVCVFLCLCLCVSVCVCEEFRRSHRWLVTVVSYLRSLLQERVLCQKMKIPRFQRIEDLIKNQYLLYFVIKRTSIVKFL